MAKHETHKATMSGKAKTLARRQARAVKYSAPDLDLETLARELGARVPTVFDKIPA